MASTSSYIFYDLNVRDPFVTDSTALMLEDTKVVVQSVWRLLTTEEGEIPYFRSYGLNVKKFLNYPLTKDTADMIYEYVENQLSLYEQRATIINAFMDVDYINGYIIMVFTMRVNSTGETFELPTWRVKVSSNV